MTLKKNIKKRGPRKESLKKKKLVVENATFFQRISNAVKRMHAVEFMYIKSRHDHTLPLRFWLPTVILISSFALTGVIHYAETITWRTYALLTPPIIRAASLDENCLYPRKLDGVCLDSPMNINKPIFSLMIENSLDAQPLSGIGDASIVIEALVEGPITRFLAFYPFDTLVKKIGPIRSARPYYLGWSAAFKALYAHVGGSPEALSMISRYGMKNFDEYSKTSYFWRGQNRDAPHNVYTSGELLRDGYNSFFEDTKIDYKGFSFKDNAEEAIRGEDNQSIIVDFSKESYRVGWIYNRNANTYERFQNDEPYRDENGNGVFANTLIVQFADSKVLDSVGRRSFDTIGTSEARVFRDGYSYDVLWRKDSFSDETRFFSIDGDKDIPFNRGLTWIHLIDLNVSRVEAR